MTYGFTLCVSREIGDPSMNKYKRMNKIVRRLLPAVLTAAVIVGTLTAMTVNVSAAGTQGLETRTYTQQELRNYYKSHPVQRPDYSFSQQPSVTAPYALGAVSNDCLQDALNLLNIYRMIAGTEPVQITQNAQRYAQAGALNCAIRNELDHFLSTPSDMDSEMAAWAAHGMQYSNLAGGGRSLTDTITRYMLETYGDPAFGHRRHLLKYDLSEVGFGVAESTTGDCYMSAYVGTTRREDKVMSYPGVNQPIEFFGPGYAWTVIVPQKITKDSVRVKITDTKTGKTWDFSTSQGNLKIYEGTFGGACLVFAPSPISYRDGDKYKVDITGIPTPISYEVNMFYIGDKVPVESVSCNVSHVFTYADPEGTGTGSWSSATMTAHVMPENASNQIVDWVSADPSIAVPEWEGTNSCTAKGLKPGTTTFTGTTDDGGYTVNVTVVVRPKAQSIDAPDEVTVGLGQSITVAPKALPEESEDDVGFRYTFDKTIVKVDGDLVSTKKTLTGLKEGTTDLTWYAGSNHNITKTTRIKVVPAVLVNKITLNRDTIELKKDETFQLVATCEPANATLKGVTWSTSNKNVAKVSSDGLVTIGYSAGMATITATAIDGSGTTATCKVIKHSHQLEQTPAVPATCENPGVNAYWTCKTCGDMFSNYGSNLITEPVIIPALGHSYSTYYTIDKAATCAEEGVKSHHCTRSGCNAIEPGSEVTIPKTDDHSYGEWTVDKQNTCIEEGSRWRVCSVCGRKETEVLPVTNHTWKTKYTQDVAPTCSSEGQKSIHCKVCGAVKPGSVKAIAKLPHSFGDWTVIREATTEQTGLKERTCTRCSYTEQAVIDKLAPPSSGDQDYDDYEWADDDSYYEDDYYEPADISYEVSPSHPADAALIASRITQIRSDSDQRGSAFGLLQAKGTPKSKSSNRVTWKPVPGAAKYIIYGNRCGVNNRCVKLGELAGTSFTHGSLAKGTYYKYVVVAVRGDKAVAISKTIHVATKGGKVGNYKKVTVSKAVTKKAKSLKVGKTLKLSAKQVKSGKVKKHRGIAYESSNPAIATVTGKGKVRGINRGTCFIYAYAQNGISKKVKVTVK